MGVVYVPLVIVNGRYEELKQGDKIKNCAETLTFEFTTPEKVWLIEHGLDKYPTVSTTTPEGTIVFGQVDYVDSNTITVTFAKPFSGYAYIN